MALPPLPRRKKIRNGHTAPSNRTKRIKLTQPQKTVFLALRHIIFTTGKCPSLRQLTATIESCDIKSTWLFLNTLYRKGALKHRRMKDYHPRKGDPPMQGTPEYDAQRKMVGEANRGERPFKKRKPATAVIKSENLPENATETAEPVLQSQSDVT